MNIRNKKLTPDRVIKLSYCEVFVFGSNVEGLHMGGAAQMAYEKFGAIWGQGVGAQGQSYAIPTMHGGLIDIQPYVDEFIEYARFHPNNRFLLTRIGCGVAGFKDKDMAKLFAKTLELVNVSIPKAWRPYIIEYNRGKQRADTPEVVTEEMLKQLCKDHNYEIGAGILTWLPKIRVRYIVENKKFGYAIFGNFFFYGEEMYVFDKDDVWKDAHNQGVVIDVFRDECFDRGYAHKAIFAGIQTNFRDSNGEYIYTGDILHATLDKNTNYYLGVGAIDTGGKKRERMYALILDNNCLPLSNSQKLTRIGTVFFKLNWKEFSIPINARCSYLWAQGAPSIEEVLMMAKYTPNFDQEQWKYSALDILGAEFNWRK